MAKIAVLVGSLRQDSINRKLAQAIDTLAGDRLEFDYVDLSQLPHYNEELWADAPRSVLDLKQKIDDTDGVLFVTPEFNRSYPGILKDAIDWATRPWGDNSWLNKPAAVIGTSPGAIGAAVGQRELKTIVSAVGTALMAQPEVYFQFKPELFDDTGAVVNPDTETFLNGWIDRFAEWINRTGVRPEKLEVAS
ncbi:NADPH-dependent FMN reductase [Qingshengfaniella alkalisoli]|uniref:NAD(P)H-dependent oxidoreductase n=1 Tax=Qingshengfaniella alkalisoli TaxID=2599296 RepID=A0A5B8IWA1_9RHOB|nr:NAD(P)H-dependent oxidoreductase [Qingshengfaniella alkalisoli]QDY68798.1 NAD(P)H-dependent oxidoreductase [Qingshengfaniella alkalisoli]